MPAQQRDPATPCACRGPDSRTRVGDLERTASPVVVRGQDWSGRAAVGAWLTKPKPDYWMSDSQSRKTDGPFSRPPVLEGAVALLGLCREKATTSTDWGRAVRHCEIGRASWWERVCTNVYILVGAVYLKK